MTIVDKSMLRKRGRNLCIPTLNQAYLPHKSVSLTSAYLTALNGSPVEDVVE